MVKSSSPQVLTRAIKRYRDRMHFYDEIKWANAASVRNASAYEDITDLFFSTGAGTFSCFVLDKSRIDPIARYGDIWSAYEQIAGLAVAYGLHDDELPTVLADDMSTPSHVRFEENLQAVVVGRGKRCGPVLRVDSKGVQLVQIADLLMGAVAYEYKLATAVISAPNSSKIRLLSKLRGAVGTPSLAGPLKAKGFRVVELR